MRNLCILCLLLLPLSGIAATPDPATLPAELQYPRETVTPQGRVVIHAPQIETWEDFDTITGSLAVEVTLADMDSRALGTVSFEGQSVTELEKLTVTFFDLRIVRVTFPDATAEQSAQLESFIRNTMTRTRQTIPLDLVLQYLADDVIPTGPSGLSLDPPIIFYATRDSRLLLLDGPPLMVPVENTNLQFAVNTNWDLFYAEADSTWYLRDGKRWLVMSGKDLTGDWQSVGNLPADFDKLPDTRNWENVRAAVPAKADDSPVPEIFSSEVPAELIVVDGEPQLAAIADTGISYVSNTDADLFLYEGMYYYLVSGRWFSAKQPGSDWSVVDELPEAFATIPPDHPRGDVLVAVAGTDEAKLAVLEAVIPRKAELSRNYVPPVNVQYSSGEPQFESIPSTQVFIAVNTQYQVLKFDKRFYLCYNAAWFVSPEPVGPWVVADQIPADIYAIPMSSAAHNCTHVYVEPRDEFTVTTSYDSGYFHVYAYYGWPMYGTGWYYYPYYNYPYYYGYPRSYGSGAWYNPANGNFGAAQVISGPYGGAGRAAVYNPETGSYARGRAVWDSNEIAAQGIAYNPSTGTGVYTNRYANEDGAWGESLIKRDDKWIATQSERQGNQASVDFATSGGASGTLNREKNDGVITGSGEVSRGDKTVSSEMVRTEDGVARKFTDEQGNTSGYARNSEGDLYAGKDGQVYKREDGNWYQHDGGEWDPVERESRVPENLQLQQSDVEELGQRMDRELAEQRASGADRQPGRDDLGANRENFGGNRENLGAMRDYPDSRDRQRDARNSRTRQLDRDYNARRNGFDRHNSNLRNRGANRGANRGGRARGGGRRR